MTYIQSNNGGWFLARAGQPESSALWQIFGTAFSSANIWTETIAFLYTFSKLSCRVAVITSNLKYIRNLLVHPNHDDVFFWCNSISARGSFRTLPIIRLVVSAFFALSVSCNWLHFSFAFFSAFDRSSISSTIPSNRTSFVKFVICRFKLKTAKLSEPNVTPFYTFIFNARWIYKYQSPIIMLTIYSHDKTWIPGYTIYKTCQHVACSVICSQYVHQNSQ